MGGKKVGLALLGAGVFACAQYVPNFRDLSDVVTLRAVWSRSQEVALEGATLVKDFSPDVQAKWGDQGLEDILTDENILGVAIVLPAQVQLEYVLKALAAGKHVLQDVTEVRNALAKYMLLSGPDAKLPIWAVAENYRFEPALMEAAKWVKEAGDVSTVHVTAEAAMNSANPYFHSAWRRDPGLKGGFVLDGGVHFVAGLRLITSAEVTSVSAIARHLDPGLPPPDNVSALFHMSNGCAGTLVMSFSAVTKKVGWRVLCSKGTVDVERSTQDTKHGYLVTYFPVDGKTKKFFGAFAGVQEEIKAFAADVANVAFEGKDAALADQRSSVPEALCDVAVVEALLKSSDAQGSLQRVAEGNQVLQLYNAVKVEMPYEKPTLALLGAGIFVRSDYVPCLRELEETVSLRAIWSRSEESATSTAHLVKDFSPDVSVKWGDDGLNEIFQDENIHCVATVLSAEVQLDIVLRALEAGKHVLQGEFLERGFYPLAAVVYNQPSLILFSKFYISNSVLAH